MPRRHLPSTQSISESVFLWLFYILTNYFSGLRIFFNTAGRAYSPLGS